MINYTRPTITSLTNALLFLFPIGINALKGFGDLILLLLAILGIIHYFSRGIGSIDTKGFKIFCLAVLGYYGVILFSVLFSGQASYLAHYLSRDLHFVFSPLVLIACSAVKINIRLFIFGVKLGLIIMGMISFYEFQAGDIRPTGRMNAGHYANLVVMQLFILIAYSLIYFKKINLLSVSAIFFGLSAIILSDSRAAWVSGLLLIGFSFFLIFKYLNINRRFLTTTLLGLFISAVFISTVSDNVVKRLDHTVYALSSWNSGENKSTSSGFRLEMYRGSLLALKDVPITGFGYRHEGITEVVAEYVDESVKDKISGFMQLHNGYINHTFYGGILGLAAYIFLLIFPLRQFKRALSKEDVQYWGFSGLLLCFGYATFGVLNNVFGDVIMNAFYVLFISLFFSQVTKNNKPIE